VRELAEGARHRGGADEVEGASQVKRVLFLVLALLGLVLAPRAAHAGAATDVVKAKQTALFDLLRTDAPQAKIAAIFDEMLDYSALAQASLGSEWASRTDAEKAEFTGILKQLVQKAYEKNLRKTLEFSIEYVGEETSGEATLVRTKAASKVDVREEPIEISYKMIQVGGAWRVQDIETEGVSLVTSYRNQFTKVIKKDGFPALIKKMKDKLAKGDV
jgi:phospholipid transport system substrate-binding protein